MFGTRARELERKLLTPPFESANALSSGTPDMTPYWIVPIVVIENGPIPAINGEPETPASAPVLALIVYAETLFEPLLPT